MRYEHYNPNPAAANAGDCVIRAICKAEGQAWDTVYTELCVYGLMYGDFPNANSIWDRYLRERGYKRYVIPNTCPECMTISLFAAEHPAGTYILATGTHVVTVQNGVIYDSWDSSQKIPIYYYSKE